MFNVTQILSYINIALAWINHCLVIHILIYSKQKKKISSILTRILECNNND